MSISIGFVAVSRLVSELHILGTIRRRQSSVRVGYLPLILLQSCFVALVYMRVFSVKPVYRKDGPKLHEAIYNNKYT